MADPLVKIQFKPGLNLDNAALANEDGFADGDKVRFVGGLPQFIGGRQQVLSGTLRGIVRAGHSWPVLDGTAVAAIGTTKGLFGYAGDAVREISPVDLVLALLGTATASSATYTVDGNSVGLVGDRVYVRHISNTATPDNTGIDGWGTIATTGADTATVTLDKASLASNVGVCLVARSSPSMTEGEVDGSSTERPIYWSMDNFGEQMVAVKGPPPSVASADYPLYAWTPRASYPNILDNPAMTTSAAWARGTGWYYGSTSQKNYVVTNYGNLSQNVAGEMLPNRIYTAVFTISDSRNAGDSSNSTYAGVGYLKMNAGTPAAEVHIRPIEALSSYYDGSDASQFAGTEEDGANRAKITAKGTYAVTFYAPQTPSDIVIQAGTDDEVTTSGNFGVDNFTLYLWPNAYPITEAPLNMSAIFTFNNVLVGLGGLQVNAEYNPLNVRCSDLGNIRAWTPDTNSLATESQLRKGGRAVGGIATRNMGLVWTDAAVYGLNWLSSVGQAFSLDMLGAGCGLIGPNAMCEQNGYVFWASTSGPYTFSGGAPQVIECSMKADVFDNIADYQGDKIWARMLPKFNEVWFGYPDARDDDGDNKEVSRQAVYNFTENHWTRHIWDVTAWISPSVFERPMGFSIASSSTSKMMWHEVGGSDNGAAISAFLLTGAFDIEDGGNIMRVTEMWPEWKNLTCDVTYTLNSRMYHNAPNMIAGVPLVLKPTTIPPLRPRRDGRQFQIRLDTSTTTLGGRQGTLRVRAQKTGATR